MSGTVLVIDDVENARRNISVFLTTHGYEVLSAATLQEGREYLRRGEADVIVADVELPDGYGPSLLEETKRMPTRPPVIIITAFGEVEMAVSAMRNGAHDFLQKPIQLDQLEQSIQRAYEIVCIRRELNHLRAMQTQELDFIVAQSPSLKALLEQAQRAAHVNVPVLLTGETGTGKEVMARAIHRLSEKNRQHSERPFVPINCAAIQSTMLESELFGYEAGAFTGAEKRKNGLMEMADGGTLFLDEISSLPLDIQPKLLRALEEHTFFRVGGTKQIRVDVQIIAASNQDLPVLIQKGQFREDLYYRLQVIELHIPPLRERKEDIPQLIGYFINQNNPRMGCNIEGLTPRALEAMLNYSWPGNVRELRNVIERAMILCDDNEIDLPYLAINLQI